jgi:hypothetical protein
MSDICASPNCGYITQDNITTCPRCGGRMRSAKQKSRLGWVLMFLGLFIMALVGIFCLAPILQHPAAPGSGPVFDRSAAQEKAALALFSVLILLGIDATIAGIFQIKTGRRNTWTLVLGAVLLLAVLGAAGALKKSLH